MAGLQEDNSAVTGTDAEVTSQGSSEVKPDSQGSLECPICLQPCMHPVELPCHHIFCFLCIKGVAMQGPNSKCAICRATIPYSVLTNPQLKDVSQLYKEAKLANGYQWYYESRSGGWWQYDERTMQDLERAFSSNQPSCQLLLAGHLYVVDFKDMIQYRSNNRSVSRRIKRDITGEKKGVAGIRTTGNSAGPGSSGGTNNGSPPPSQSSGSSGRRRRGNSSASSNLQTASVPGQYPPSGFSFHGATGPVNPTSGAQNSTDSPILDNEVPNTDSDDESVEEDEDYDSDYSAEVDEDDDMELGEEEEALIGDDSDERETDDEDEQDTRDGARAPTRRSDRSNSSNNQTPPPPSGAGITNGASGRTYSPNPNGNGRGSRGARSGRSSGGGRSNNSSNGTASRATNVQSAMSDPHTYSVTSHASISSSAPQFYNRCNLEDSAATRGSVPNNNIYVDPQIIGQVLSNIAATSSSVTIAHDRRSKLNHEEYL